MNKDEDFTTELLTLKKKIECLEEIFDEHQIKDSGMHDTASQILKRINNIQNLVDQIEIEIDNLEMRISAIEHMSFRLRTDGL
ncbi:MAG: hypothetical protein AM325_008570 [Candidatus Thorarchaeota archaeon SMTZ1-45]|nr:MAG: hypothetical protein AM325_10285 [Candidatus Thorarchaeota archaeon SMTZ1-45]